MPNWVVNEINAPEEVLQELIDDKGIVTFEKLIPTAHLYDEDGCVKPEYGILPATYLWGTKWDATEANYDGDGFMTFNTAWSIPYNVLQRLSEKHPEAVIQLKFADENFGNNCGEIDFKGGVPIRDNTAPFNPPNDELGKWIKFAVELWGYDEDPSEFGCDSAWNYLGDQ